MEFKSHSKLMEFFLLIKKRKLAWALRRLYCPVSKNALVLEVGAGGNPYPRSNVIVDAYEESYERGTYNNLPSDRPVVVARTESLPFKDKSFDFVIASHVLEHSDDPIQFLSELQRVAKAGYIEVPDAFCERINPWPFHRLEISLDQHNKLIIRKKPKAIVDEDLEEIVSYQCRESIRGEFMDCNPFVFNVRYYWKDKIDYLVTNDNVDCSFEYKKEAMNYAPNSIKERIRILLVKVIRILLSQCKRNSKLDITHLLICPKCGSQMKRKDDFVICVKCDEKIKKQGNKFIFSTD